MSLPVHLAARVQRLTEVAGSPAPWPASTPESARANARLALDRGETHYTDRPGIAPLREEIARRLEAEFGQSLTASDVVVTCGVTEARFVAVQCLLQPGRTLYISGLEPAVVEGAAALAGGHTGRLSEAATEVSADDVVYVDVRAGELDAVWDQLAERGPHVILEAPLGAQVSRGIAGSLTDRCVLVGNVGGREGLIGWRVGFLAAWGPTLGAMRDLKQALTICTTNLSQWAALAWLQEVA